MENKNIREVTSAKTTDDFLTRMEAAIFDLDGTLLDSMWLWNEVDRRYIESKGFKADEAYLQALSMMSFTEASEYIIKRFGLDITADEMFDEWHECAREAYRTEVTLKEGVREYLDELKEMGIPMAIATAGREVIYGPCLERLDLVKYFETIVDHDQIIISKSSPDMFLEAAERIGVNPENTLLFEDIPKYIHTAKNAGFSTCVVFDELQAAHWNIISDEADYAIHHFADAPRPLR